MRIYIYLTEIEKIKLKKIQQKYIVSLSTICEKVIWNFLRVVNRYCNADDLDLDKIEKIKKKEYLYSIKGNQRTSVKPKDLKPFKIPAQWITNTIKMYANNSWKEVIKNKDAINRILSGIDLELKNTYDRYYNYNETLRNSIRVIKENKDYIERLQKKVKENEH